MADRSICKIEGCSKGGRLRRGWCAAHYKRWWKNGNARPSEALVVCNTAPGDAQRFYREVAIPFSSDDCLVWPYTKRKGYAIIAGRVVSRMVCEQVKGPPPTPQHQAAHSCGNSICVNPRHLSWKTRSQNEIDKHVHGTALRGEKALRGGKLTSADVLRIRELLGEKSQAEIARMYGVSTASIHAISSGRSWAWL
jgi:hypothetical protein